MGRGGINGDWVDFSHHDQVISRIWERLIRSDEMRATCSCLKLCINIIKSYGPTSWKAGCRKFDKEKWLVTSFSI
jgi:hypothetical protein